ncbi:MAG TPA: beta-ketoacyl-[acyl-carrier-protein] synthase family protein [Bacteroidales bacterium]|nr:beta-ketoacyl-[acyl-carrier-protein] synthase family protein [Bacteroidales bacterium]
MAPRVFITGVGIISAIGNGIAETRESLKNFRSGIGKLSLFNSVHDDIPVAEVKHDNEALTQIAGISNDGRIYTRNTLLALIAASQALQMSEWNSNPDRKTGAVFATTVGGMDFNEQFYLSLLKEDKYKDFISVFDSADCAEKVASFFGISRNVTTISTACSSSANAILFGSRLIKSNRLNRVLVGGTDALTRFTLNGFFALEILSPTGCRPFDKSRNGLSIGEGAAFLVLESGHTADPKKIICEVTGYANVNEAYHATASTSDGIGAAKAMNEALESAHLKASQIDYINAHGTGTEINDLSEGKAIETVFGGTIPPVSSTKAFTGHTLGAAGAVEAVFSAIAIMNQSVLPNLNFCEKMPELSFEPQKDPEARLIRNVMSNSFGFGGSNTTLIFSNV